MKTLFSIFFLIFSMGTFAQDAARQDYISKDFLILYSGKDYPKALQVAKQAAPKLKLKLDLRGLKPHRQTGLSNTKTACEDDFGFYPCYLTRGYYPDGAYLSIEHSDAFPEFRKGYYIVVAAAYDKGNPELKSLLQKARIHFRDAYLKSSEVYTGCIH
jgi:hypothetical protein